MRERTIEEWKTEFFACLIKWRSPLEENLREWRKEPHQPGSRSDNIGDCLETGIGILDLCKTKVHAAQTKKELLEIRKTLTTALDRQIQATEHCKAIGDQKPN